MAKIINKLVIVEVINKESCEFTNVKKTTEKILGKVQMNNF